MNASSLSKELVILALHIERSVTNTLLRAALFEDGEHLLQTMDIWQTIDELNKRLKEAFPNEET